MTDKQLFSNWAYILKVFCFMQISFLWFLPHSESFFPCENDTFEFLTGKLRAYAQHEELQRNRGYLLQMASLKDREAKAVSWWLKYVTEPWAASKLLWCCSCQAAAAPARQSLCLGTQALCLPFKSSRRSHRMQNGSSPSINHTISAEIPVDTVGALGSYGTALKCWCSQSQAGSANWKINLLSELLCIPDKVSQDSEKLLRHKEVIFSLFWKEGRYQRLAGSGKVTEGVEGSKDSSVSPQKQGWHGPEHIISPSAWRTDNFYTQQDVFHLATVKTETSTTMRNHSCTESPLSSLSQC